MVEELIKGFSKVARDKDVAAVFYAALSIMVTAAQAIGLNRTQVEESMARFWLAGKQHDEMERTSSKRWQ